MSSKRYFKRVGKTSCDVIFKLFFLLTSTIIFFKMTNSIQLLSNFQSTQYMEVQQDLNENKCNEMHRNKKKHQISLVSIRRASETILPSMITVKNRKKPEISASKTSEFFLIYQTQKKKSKQKAYEQPPEEKEEVSKKCTKSKRQYSDPLSTNDEELSQISIVSKNDDNSLENKNSTNDNIQKKEIETHASILPNLEDEKVSAVLYGAKPNIFFKTRQSLADLINEQHIITYFQNDSKWKNDLNIPDNEKYCQLFFAFNLKFKLYLTIMLTLVDLPWILKVGHTIDNILLKTINYITAICGFISICYLFYLLKLYEKKKQLFAIEKRSKLERKRKKIKMKII
ncbi:hypothetical protein RFI_21900 [Reticulomyxa filosa]|uniref:Uncharacterized protein n=1 Tax=Reticulomyxa filosa TaxID=46433 RepID=X6MNA0_RETFI|nr:hypothetical protein RFI_21900 [Reticulomyxa filosa]|eukprot:ETO15463.1 hypothetical protein RFI_21900 [Reticulomyxa filosa]